MKNTVKILKKLTSAALAVALLAMGGCSSPPPQGGDAPPDQIPKPTEVAMIEAFSQLNITAKDLPAPDGASDAATARVAAAVNAFTFDMTAQMPAEGENIVVSPLSVAFTLAALANAADGPARETIIAAMGLPGMTIDELNSGFAGLLYALTNPGWDEMPNPLAIANAVFVDGREVLDEGFATDVLNWLRATAISVDFSSREAVDAINRWCSDNTGGKIDKIIDKFDDPDAVAAIANAIYFSDRWFSEFDEAETAEADFYGVSGKTVAHMMSKEAAALPYYEDDALQAVDLRFVTGGGLLVLLPKNGDASALLAGLDAERFGAITDGLAGKTGLIKLPRFSVDYDAQMIDTLSALGFDSLFDENDPILTRLLQGREAYISQCAHKALIEVDEKGTTAAAVTVAIASATGALLPTDPFEMICDRPFAFVLHTYAGQGQVALFAGVVNGLE